MKEVYRIFAQGIGKDVKLAKGSGGRNGGSLAVWKCNWIPRKITRMRGMIGSWSFECLEVEGNGRNKFMKGNGLRVVRIESGEGLEVGRKKELDEV
ncbi:hypothetical protein SUGI_0615770 [Cryptomeria japonica]|nr:hypothetical protein SUGI_0615770 [Cryptomeria japonica]